jgi:hypothetical protein
MIDAYVDWGPRIKVGDVQQWMYNELIDFVNFRIETAETCLLLVQAERVADALGLCRSLLEHYLLLMLRCRGRKFFKLTDCSNLKEPEFKRHLADEQRKAEEARQRGEKTWLAVSKYPRATRHVMYVIEGYASADEPGFVIPFHYFQLENINPEIMRLGPDGYFQYFEHEPAVKKTLAKERENMKLLYRHYFSYEAMLQCLELNELADGSGIRRIEAHYTFLGQFIHPTHNAARQLHVDSNRYDGRPAIGIDQPYTKVAQLLVALYVCYLLSSLLDEITSVHEAASSRYIADPGTTEIRQVISIVPAAFPYFWFINNKPPLWDKYNHAAHHVSDEGLKAAGGYAELPDDTIPFDSDIYGHLQRALTSVSGWCGLYRSPLI